MTYLRKPIATPENTNKGDRKQTVVDIYVEKQLKYVEAQIEWDNQQDKNAGGSYLTYARSTNTRLLTSGGRSRGPRVG